MKRKTKKTMESDVMSRTMAIGVLVLVIVLGLFFLRSESGQKLVNLPFNGVSSEAAAAKIHRSAKPVPGQYIVVLKNDISDVDVTAETLSRRYEAQLKHVYKSALKGFVVNMPEAQLERLAAEDAVNFIEEDSLTSIETTQDNATWGLDRIDQRNLPINAAYNYETAGQGVTAYILDTGIRISHTDFGGRARISYDAIGDGQNGFDCHGHGTHVAGTVGSNTYGVAKAVSLVAVRVLPCSGGGMVSQLIMGIDWVTANHVGPSVANISITASGISTALEQSVTQSINSGVVYSVAAGNNNLDACNYSPAHTPKALTVAATASNDSRASYSNYGSCVDLFAPGTAITSLSNGDDVSTRVMSGTSMASPHVAGAAALYLSTNPSATPGTVASALTSSASADKLSSVGTGSPNSLLYSLAITGTTNPPPTDPPPTDPPPTTACSGVLYTSSISAGATNYHPLAGFSGRAGTYTGTVTGRSGGILNVALEQKKGRSWNQVAISPSSASPTTAAFTGGKGTYRWRVTSAADNTYTLCTTAP